MNISYSLIENGLDFLESALNHLADEKDIAETARQKTKYAVLHLASGAELLVKECLRQTDWKLLFDRVERADDKLYASGDFFSVRFDDALERLENSCSIVLTDKQEAALKSLRMKRNKLEHFGIVDNHAALRSLASEVVSILMNFMRDYFTTASLADQEATLRTIRAKLSGCEAIVRQRWSEIEAEVNKLAKVYQCPACHQMAWAINGWDVRVRCLFCTHDVESAIAAEEYAYDALGYSRYESYKEGMPVPISSCVDCDNHALVDCGEYYVCFACGEESWNRNLRRCETCEVVYLYGEDDCGMCEDCMERQMEDHLD